MPEEFVNYEGSVRITVTLGDGRVFEIVRDDARVIGTHETVELPDARHGYMIHTLRQEDTYKISLITHGNWSLLDPREIDEEPEIVILDPKDVDFSDDIVDTEAETKEIDYDPDFDGLDPFSPW